MSSRALVFQIVCVGIVIVKVLGNITMSHTVDLGAGPRQINRRVDRKRDRTDSRNNDDKDFTFLPYYTYRHRDATRVGLKEKKSPRLVIPMFDEKNYVERNYHFPKQNESQPVRANSKLARKKTTVSNNKLLSWEAFRPFKQDGGQRQVSKRTKDRLKHKRRRQKVLGGRDFKRLRKSIIKIKSCRIRSKDRYRLYVKIMRRFSLSYEPYDSSRWLRCLQRIKTRPTNERKKMSNRRKPLKSMSKSSTGNVSPTTRHPPTKNVYKRRHSKKIDANKHKQRQKSNPGLKRLLPTIEPKTNNSDQTDRFNSQRTTMHQGEETRDICDQYDVNGCSIPFGAPFFFKKLFTKSCYRHDICYHCGVKYHVARLACDNALKHNTLEACQAKYGNGSDRKTNSRKHKLIVSSIETLRDQFQAIARQEMNVMMAVAKEANVENFHNYAIVVLRKIFKLWVKHITKRNSITTNHHTSSLYPASFASYSSPTSPSPFSSFPTSPSTSFQSSSFTPVSSTSPSRLSSSFSPSSPSFFRYSKIKSKRPKVTKYNLKQRNKNRIKTRRQDLTKNINLVARDLCNEFLMDTKHTGVMRPGIRLTCRDVGLVTCNAFSELYFIAVRAFGSQSFHNTPEFFCGQPFVPKCLPLIPKN